MLTDLYGKEVLNPKLEIGRSFGFKKACAINYKERVGMITLDTKNVHDVILKKLEAGKSFIRKIHIS